MDDPLGLHWGYQLMTRAGVRSGVLYPILQRMLDGGWLQDGWEDPQVIAERRPARRYYEVTDRGRRELGAIISEASADPRFVSLLAWAQGTR